MEWHYAAGGESKGPVSDEELTALVNEGAITAETMVWHEGMEEWTPYSQISGDAPASAGSAPGVGTCAECGRSFPTSEMITYSGSTICAECKPAFIQRIAEGAPTGAMEYGGFWIRFAAKWIDGIIMWVVNMAVAMLGMALIMGAMNPNDPTAAMTINLIMQLLQIALGAAFTTFFLGKFAATPGKMACGLKVVRSDGSKVTYARALGRHFAEMLSGMILGIGYLMAAFDEEKRTLHDRICDTRVIKKQK